MQQECVQIQRSMHAATFEYFSSESHIGFLDDVSFIFIDKIDPKDLNKQKHYCRQTMALQCFNVEDD